MGVNAADFDFISKFVKSEAGIVLEKGKEYLVESRLEPLAKNEGFTSLSALVDAVRTGKNSAVKRKIVDALTTNETSFYRDVTPFEILRTSVLPAVIEHRKEKQHLRIWCAASSTGQEPYSIAMLIREHFPQLQNWKVEIVATDICRDVLERARRGIFSQLEINRGLPVTYLVKYFEKRGTEWAIKDCVKNIVQFHELNLLQPVSIFTDVDIVLIRNVLIYFDLDTKRDILGRIRKVMRSDGYLFLGAAETTLNVDDSYERRAFGGGSCYQIKA